MCISNETYYSITGDTVTVVGSISQGTTSIVPTLTHTSQLDHTNILELPENRRDGRSIINRIIITISIQ